MWLGCTSPRAADVPPLTEFFRPSLNIHDIHLSHIQLFAFVVNVSNLSDQITPISPVVAIDIGAGSGYASLERAGDRSTEMTLGDPFGEHRRSPRGRVNVTQIIGFFACGQRICDQRRLATGVEGSRWVTDQPSLDLT